MQPNDRPVRVLVVDDEPHARSIVRRMLGNEAGYEVVGEAASGDEAVRLIEMLAPELVILDVQMPGLSGLEVIAKIGVRDMPHVIFVTAFDHYALRAFDVHAVDYLLKPFSRLRFRRALERARERRARVEEGLTGLLEELATTHPPLDRLAVKRGDGVFLMPVRDVIWIEANGKTALAHSRDASHLLRQSMKEIEKRLDSRRFTRVHRSAIVNVEHVTEIHPMFKGTFVMVLSDGTRITTGPTYRDRVQPLLENRPRQT